MKNVPQIFGSQVFNDTVMKKRIPAPAYETLRKTVETGVPLEREAANEIAKSMKEWAIELGATHFTHWFAPMTGTTAGKHDSFIMPDGEGNVIMEFSGKELVKGEPDASSFPSGGIRATFEARGYTAWDPSSYAFVREGSLFIPTAFCSYNGEALDKKTPLLRSMEALDKASVRLLHLFGNEEVKKVIPTVGPEQEYFIIDKDIYLRRPDLVYTGRTLFGAKPPKGQELDDQYFGQLKPRIVEFMAHLDSELWRLGINAKTKHNEVAPAQHEMAPVYTTVNVATDHNQLTMDVMKKTADRFGLVCLLHEKPFEGVNGSGKHNNWSLTTDTGENLLNPGFTPAQNAQFLLFLSAVIKGVDDYQELLRISVADAGNDHRLGAAEAPPAIMSIFVGDDLQMVLDAVAAGETLKHHKRAVMDLGVSLIPRFKRDNTDRNRTSPFAFTGNKFEFRSLGSSSSIAEPNTVLNSIVADSLNGFYEELKNSDELFKDAMELVKRTIINHKRIIFNGNGYSKEWEKEAARRGLLNLRTTPDALARLSDKKNVDMFARLGVYSHSELAARYEILMLNYCNTLSIEALTMVSMVNKFVTPAVLKYEKTLSELICSKSDAGLSAGMEKPLLEQISSLADVMSERLAALETAIAGAKDIEGTQETGDYYKDNILAAMQLLREVVDRLEPLISDEYWELPTYAQMLFSVI